MKPGRELDAIIAEKVMGWSVRNGQLVNQDWEPDEPDHYSTDIAAAWAVVHEMKRKGFNLVLSDSVISGIDSVASTWCSFGIWRSRVTPTVGEDFPHAICLAALKATSSA